MSDDGLYTGPGVVRARGSFMARVRCNRARFAGVGRLCGALSTER